MKKLIIGLLFAFGLIAVSGMDAAYAQIPPIVVDVERDTYTIGDMLTINGKVHRVHDGAVSIVVYAENGNIVAVGQTSVGPDRHFTITFPISGELANAGIYTVFADYSLSSNQPRTATSTFVVNEDVQILSVTPEGTDIPIEYTSTEGRIVEINTDQTSSTMTIKIESDGVGTMVITVPREVFDSKTDGDLDLIVDVSGGTMSEINTTELTRTFTVSYGPGTHEIIMAGTYAAVPEFGIIIPIILVAGLIGAMFAGRFGNQLMFNR